MTTLLHYNAPTLRVRIRWPRFLYWSPTDRQWRHFYRWVINAGRMVEKAIKLWIICSLIFIGIEIACAFLPGGAVERVMGGR